MSRNDSIRQGDARVDNGLERFASVSEVTWENRCLQLPFEENDVAEACSES